MYDVFQTLPKYFAQSLIAFHALTGCDTKSHFALHSKKSAWKVFTAHHNILMDLGIGDLDHTKVQHAEEVICKMYNLHGTTTLDTVRYMQFAKAAKPEAMAPTCFPASLKKSSFSDYGLEKGLHSRSQSP